MKILTDLFGPATWGTGGNLVAWALCGIPAFAWHHRRIRREIRREIAKARHPSGTTATSSATPRRPPGCR